MPRTRSDRRREDKREEIVTAAGARLEEGGYAALSVAALARELGVAQNSIYWYFPSKDHLFVAALERMLAAIAEATPGADLTVPDRVLWFTDRLAPVWSHSDVIQQRRAHSEVIAELAARLDAAASTMLANALRDSVPGPELDVACDAFRTLVEGTYARRLPQDRRHRVLRHVLSLMLAPTATAHGR